MREHARQFIDDDRAPGVGPLDGHCRVPVSLGAEIIRLARLATSLHMVAVAQMGTDAQAEPVEPTDTSNSGPDR